jgi:threonine/homoserine/homoserine lactone efflux protein
VAGGRATLKQLLKHAGVAYLQYLAVATWRERSAFVVQEGGARRSALSLMVKAFPLNILNPKLTIYRFAARAGLVAPQLLGRVRGSGRAARVQRALNS